MLDLLHRQVGNSLTTIPSRGSERIQPASSTSSLVRNGVLQFLEQVDQRIASTLVTAEVKIAAKQKGNAIVGHTVSAEIQQQQVVIFFGQAAQPLPQTGDLVGLLKFAAIVKLEGTQF